jgi:lipid-binding SYLF domain-containing protein
MLGLSQLVPGGRGAQAILATHASDWQAYSKAASTPPVSTPESWQTFCTTLQASRIGSEVHLPTAVLAGARGIVAMSLLKVGAGWSATYGTGALLLQLQWVVWQEPC